MAGKQGGSVGAFGWTLLGFLAGVAATLAMQMLLMGADRGDDPPEDAPHATGAVVVTPKLAAPAKPAHHPAKSGAPDGASAAAAYRPKPEAPDAQVADDAAAAGMTSRAAPKPADPDPNTAR